MRRMLFLAICLSLLTAAIAHAEVKIAVFNAADVAVKTQVFKDNEQILKKFESRNQALEKDRETIRTKMAEGIKTTPTKQQQDEILKLQADFQKKAETFSQDLQKAEAQVRTDVDATILEASKNYAKEKGYNLILDANLLLYYDLPNVSEDILKEADKVWKAKKKK